MIITPLETQISACTRVSGEARCILYDENMKPIYDSGWDKNVICNQGLDLIHTLSSPTGHTYVGDGVGPVLETNSAMSNLLANSQASGSGGDVYVQPVAPNYEWSRTRSRRFGAGIGTGTITEVGMGGNSTSSQLICRQLLGSPISKGITQSLDVIWRWTIWPELLGVGVHPDKLGVIDIGGIAYNYILRSRNLLATKSNISPPGSGVFGPWTKYVASKDSFWGAWSGDIIDATSNGTPSGTYASGFGTPSVVVGSYSSPQRFVLLTNPGNLGSYNISGGIRSMTATASIGLWQCQFNAVSDGGKIPKTGSNEIETVWKFSWDRHV